METKIILRELLWINSDTRLIAINNETKEEIVIHDLYWFEENGVHDFGGDGHDATYSFRMERNVELDP